MQTQTRSSERAPRSGALIVVLAMTAVAAVVTVVAGILLLMPAASSAAGRPHHHKHHGHKHHGHKHPPAPPLAPTYPAPALGSVTVTDAGPGRRAVAVETTGPPMDQVEICDLSTFDCASAEFGSGRWIATLPAPDPARYTLGVIARSGGVWVTDRVSSDPPAEVPPIVNVG